VVHDGARTGRLARDGDLGRVAAELADVELDPCQDERLVENAGIDSALLLDFARREPAKRAELFRVSFNSDDIPCRKRARPTRYCRVTATKPFSLALIISLMSCVASPRPYPPP
jgi:hypothetical protein